uniref:Protein INAPERTURATE POLLEN1 n=1 Tax=Elaeis guineensis var. tenera TaxID=51953 RepID=A0A6I9R3J4_ELAGV|nr:protein INAPERTURATE POLLEN1 [Elaeis guineensis]
MMRSAGDLLSCHLFSNPRNATNPNPNPNSRFLSPTGRIGRKKSSRPFKDFYAEWVDALQSTLLPLLRHSMSAALLDHPVAHRGLLGGGAMVSSSDLLSTHVHALHAHFQAYFQALDLAARHDVSQLLSSDWRNPLETPFLWLGDFHPAMLPTLLRSFLHPPFDEPRRPLPFALAWTRPSRDLTARIDQIERGLRLIVPALASRLRDAQASFLEAAAAEWAASRGKEVGSLPPAKNVDAASGAQLEELASVFLDSNRLRRSVLAEIVEVLDVYQAALYLEALAQFVVGFRDPELLRDFEQCRMPPSPPGAA